MSATFGRYRLDRVLGRGGMGVVHAARDTVLDREVALKIVAPHLADDPEFRGRFQHEAEVLAKLDSDRIVRIYDYGEHEGSLFIVTQLVDGGDLQKLVAESGPLSPALAVDVVCQVLEGLRDAHAVGVIHRDIKPANVLLRQRQGEVEAFLCDFGIAATAGAGFTQTGGVAGSLPYLAPERHEGQEATPQSDVYAVGCLLWAALTGSAPFAGTDADVLFGHLYGPVPKLPGRDDFSRRATAVLAKALAKEPRKRYPTATAMAADLRPLAERAPGSIALPGATAVRRPVVVRRRRWVAPVAAVAGVLAVVATGVVVASLGDAGPSGREALPVPATLTETVAVGDGLLLGNQVTLAPRPVPATKAGGGVVRTPGAGSALPAPPPRKPAAAEAAPAPRPKPQPRFYCWSRVVTTSLASCGEPAGWEGAVWLYPRLAELRCPQMAAGTWKTPGYRTVWECQRPNSHDGYALYYQWWESNGTVDATFEGGADWHVGGTRYGRKRVRQETRSDGTLYITDFVYEVGPWVFGVVAGSPALRDQGIALGSGFRNPAHYRGIPCAQTSAC